MAGEIQVNIKANIIPTYQFPVGTFHVQMLTAALLLENYRGYVLNDLGTGKTRSVLFAFDALKRAKLAKKLLVIGPISGMRRTWAREIMMATPSLTYVVLHGDKAKRLKELAKKVDVYIINHDGVGVIADELEAMQFDVVCVDELAVYRNGRAQRTRLLRQIVEDIHYVWGLTGSPIPRAVTDVWGQCSCLTPWTVPRYFTIFREQLMLKVDAYRWRAKSGAEERAVSCMQPAVRFTLDEVTELPQRVIQYYPCDMTPEQAKVYENMRLACVAMAKNKTIDALNAGAALSKLLQIAIGYVYTRAGEIVELDNTPRLQLILDLIDNTKHKVLLFASFKSAVHALSKMLEANQIDHAVVTGDVSPAKRNQIFTLFQDSPRYKVLLAHPVCMAHSLTLTAATTTIWAGPCTSLETFHQANGRTFRVGQSHKTLIALVGGTGVERRIYSILGRNEQMQNRFLEIVEATTNE
jgi:SNF2 family DNA or RNA helicase